MPSVQTQSENLRVLTDCLLTCTATILHGGVRVLQSAVQNKTDVGPCGLVTSVVSVFHIQTVSFSGQQLRSGNEAIIRPRG